MDWTPTAAFRQPWIYTAKVSNLHSFFSFAYGLVALLADVYSLATTEKEERGEAIVAYMRRLFESYLGGQLATVSLVGHALMVLVRSCAAYVNVARYVVLSAFLCPSSLAHHTSNVEFEPVIIA
jgi:hypothetical protein